MNYYLVESDKSWFVCFCKNKRKARSEDVFEFGRGNVKNVRIAQDDEIEYYRNIRPGALEHEERLEL